MGGFITGVTIAVVIYAPIRVGFVVARPRATDRLSVLWTLVEELCGNNQSTVSGIDDMSPIAAIPFSAFFMVFPAIGLWIADRFQQRATAP